MTVCHTIIVKSVHICVAKAFRTTRVAAQQRRLKLHATRKTISILFIASNAWIYIDFHSHNKDIVHYSRTCSLPCVLRGMGGKRRCCSDVKPLQRHIHPEQLLPRTEPRYGDAFCGLHSDDDTGEIITIWGWSLSSLSTSKRRHVVAGGVFGCNTHQNQRLNSNDMSSISITIWFCSSVLCGLREITDNMMLNDTVSMGFAEEMFKNQLDLLPHNGNKLFQHKFILINFSEIEFEKCFKFKK